MKKSGFTLIEVLIYTALIGVAGVFLNSTLISVLRLQGQQSASTVVNQQIDFVLQNIKRSVLESSLIEMEGNVASSTLKLRMTDTALDPTLIYLSGTTVYIKKGAAAALALTTADVNADQLNFTKVSSYPGHDSVSVDISFSFNTDNPQQAFTKTINSAISRVSGATFDSDILPGADATYSVGSVANRWQNLTLSGDLTVAGDSSFTGNVGIGTAIPSAGLHINTAAGTTALKVGSTTTQFIVDSSGNVGIGTTNPQHPLHISTSVTYDGIFINGNQAPSVGFNISANTTPSWKVGLSGNNASGFAISTGAAASDKLFISSVGNVGIGTITPGVLTGGFDVSGYANLQVKSANRAYLELSGQQSAIILENTDGTAGSRAFQTYFSGDKVYYNFQSETTGAVVSSPFTLQSNGNIGIGTTSPTAKLEVNGLIYSGVSGFKFPDGTIQTTAGGGSTVQAPTRQVLTSGSGTYTTPSGAGLIKIRMVGGGGGGGAGSTNDGAAGGNTSFNSVVANGGSGGGGGENSFVNGGAGGVGGTGTASFRVQGGGGGGITYGNTYAAISGGAGGNSAFGGGAAPPNESAAGNAAAANSGAGGSGGIYSSYSGGGGGGAGEYVELNITNPSASYAYTIGTGGAGGTAGSYAGGAGGSGVIIVDEYYTTALSVDVTSGGNNTFTGTNAFTNGITGMWSTVSSQTVSGVSSITFSNLAVATTYRLIATLTPTSSNTAATWYFRINNDSSASYLYGGNYAVSAAATGGLGSTAATGCPFQLSTGTMTAGADVTNLTTEPFRSSPANSARQIITYSAGSTYGNEGAIMSEKMTCYAKVGTMTSITIVPPVTASGTVILEKLN